MGNINNMRIANTIQEKIFLLPTFLFPHFLKINMDLSLANQNALQQMLKDHW